MIKLSVLKHGPNEDDFQWNGASLNHSTRIEITREKLPSEDEYWE
jgi:hypothetical protein